jgi:hypothetical protein
MKLSTAERKLLSALGSLANKLIGTSESGSRNGSQASRARGAGRRAGRTREESAKMKAEILAAVKKGASVRDVAESHGVTSPYVYQLIAKSKKGRK